MPLPAAALTFVSLQRPGRSSPTGAGMLGRIPASGTPRAVCFPHDDARFAERTQALVDAAGPDGPITATLQALLREAYPLAVVAPRHELAAGDGRRVWYAFREGSVVPVADEATR